MVVQNTRTGSPLSKLTLPVESPISTSSRCFSSSLGAAAMGIGRCDAGAIELRGRERQLVALARHAHLPRPLHIEPLTLAPGARERAVNVDVDADLGTF